MLHEAEYSSAAIRVGFMIPKPPYRGGRANNLRIVSFGGEQPIKVGISTSRMLSSRGCKASDMFGVVRQR